MYQKLLKVGLVQDHDFMRMRTQRVAWEAVEETPWQINKQTRLKIAERKKHEVKKLAWQAKRETAKIIRVTAKVEKTDLKKT